MYPASPTAVNVLVAATTVAALAGAPGFQPPPTAGMASPSTATPCDPALALLFAPAHPRTGHYEVCASAQPLTALAQPGWLVETANPSDAFGSAGSYNRAALARLYGGRRAEVARGWRTVDGNFESITLISPYPDPTLSRLEPGTLTIRLILCCR